MAIALVGSVAIPARQTWLISDLLHETTETLSPARVLAAQLHAGLAEELALVRLPIDSTTVRAFHVLADSDDFRMRGLAALADQLDSASARSIVDLNARVAEWRHESRSAIYLRRGNIEHPVEAALRAHQAALVAVSKTSALLDLRAFDRDNRMGELDRIGLGWNITLVVAALAALIGVSLMTARERRSLTAAQRRARREAALREAAGSFAGAFSVDEILNCIASAAVAVFDAVDARVERVGSATPTPPSSSELSVALGDPPLARLVIVSFASQPVDAELRSYAGIFGQLASLALEKVRALEDSNAGRRRLEQAINSRSRLIRGFSHDVKNPIGAADGYAALLGDGIYGELTAAQRESVQRIRHSIQVALMLIGELHELAAAETGHLSLKIEPVDLRELLRGLVDDYQAAARSAGVRLVGNVPDDLTPIATSGSRVRQIVSNLVSNAVKYTNGKSIGVRVRRTPAGPAAEARPWLRIDVSDEGPGIPADKQEFIFEEFSRIDPDRKPGAGLGLAISRLLAQALGGQLTLESAAGSGSTFSLWLPAVEVDDPGKPREEDSRESDFHHPVRSGLLRGDRA